MKQVGFKPGVNEYKGVLYGKSDGESTDKDDLTSAEVERVG